MTRFLRILSLTSALLFGTLSFARKALVLLFTPLACIGNPINFYSSSVILMIRASVGLTRRRSLVLRQRRAETSVDVSLRST